MILISIDLDSIKLTSTNDIKHWKINKLWIRIIVNLSTIFFPHFRHIFKFSVKLYRKYRAQLSKKWKSIKYFLRSVIALKITTTYTIIIIIIIQIIPEMKN